MSFDNFICYCNRLFVSKLYGKECFKKSESSSYILSKVDFLILLHHLTICFRVFIIPTWCQFCSKLLWSIRGGRRCKSNNYSFLLFFFFFFNRSHALVCAYSCHRRCIERVGNTCIPIEVPEEEKEEIRKTNLTLSQMNPILRQSKEEKKSSDTPSSSSQEEQEEQEEVEERELKIIYESDESGEIENTKVDLRISSPLKKLRDKGDMDSYGKVEFEDIGSSGYKEEVEEESEEEGIPQTGYSEESRTLFFWRVFSFFLVFHVVGKRREFYGWNLINIFFNILF